MNSPQNQIPMLKTHLNERDAYRALFAFGGALSGLDPAQVSNIAAAIANARLFADESCENAKTEESGGCQGGGGGLMPKKRASIFERRCDWTLKASHRRTEWIPKLRAASRCRLSLKPQTFQAASVAKHLNLQRNVLRGFIGPARRSVDAKATQETVDAMYTITDANSWLGLGYTLERAVEALQRELEVEKTS